MSRSLCAALALLAVVSGTTRAQPAPPPSPAPIPARGPVPREAAVERKLQDEFKAPDGFRVTLFAGPPIAMYPTCVAEGADGAIYACVDPNLSLSQLKGVGRVVRLVDEDGDGRADRYTTFAEMDSPRGAAFDGTTLYVMHPPNLTAYRDTNGDGIADESTDLVTGLGFDLDFRGADHGSNNVELGIDGWLYVAVGDYGFIKATGTDGRQLQHRGGGVVRVRPDGSHLELYATGTRNIYDVAIDPFARLYTRDNTNDGDGWDTRLHYLAPGADMGYPRLYQNFDGEHFPSLHDYGAGSGVGGLWIEDPAWPAGYNNTLFTADWVLQKIFRHPLTPKGSIFGIGQDDFISVLRPADFVLDGRSNLYVASLSGGEFTYSADTVGYVVRVAYDKATPPRAEATGSNASEADLLAAVTGPNAVHRIHAQRELLRRAPTATAVAALRAAALDARHPATARAAAIFTLKQLAGERANATLLEATTVSEPRVREVALRALADRTDQLSAVTSAPFVRALADADVQVRVQGITGLVRLGARDAASSIVPLTGSDDQGIASLAIDALVALGASDAAFRGVDTGSPAVRAGSLRALAKMHDAPVVTGLLARLSRAPDAPSRDALVHTLARLYNTDGVWRGDWWSTRPPHLGPYMDPTPWSDSPRIHAALVSALSRARGDVRQRMAEDFAREQVLPRGGASLAVALAGDSAESRVLDALAGRSRLDGAAVAAIAPLERRAGAVRSGLVSLLAGEGTFVESALPIAAHVALDTSVAAATRGQVLNTLVGVSGRRAMETTADVLTRLTPPATPAGTEAGPIESAWRRFVGDRRRTLELDYFIDRAQHGDAAARTLAYSVLVQSVRTPRTPAPVRERVTPVLDAAWNDPASAPALARAIEVMRVETQYAEKLAAYRQRARDWQQLFDGTSLAGWDIKFTHHDVGDNYNDTFRVRDGLLQVRYDKWTRFDGEFGHLFTQRPYGRYLVAAEYRFVGEQVTGAGSSLGWAVRNNGIMIHSQSAESMGRDQDFPISLEVQLLGGLGNGARPTANLCTPGTNVHFGDTLVTRHCTNSKSKTYDGDGWVRVEALVLGDSVIKHIANGDTVLVYRKPEVGGGSVSNTKPGVKVDGTPLSRGYIALQAETAPIDFRRVEILDLEGCADIAECVKAARRP